MIRDPKGPPQWVAGVDGCPGGWIAVFWDVTGQSSPLAQLFPAFADLLADPHAPQRMAVDMPIGLPDRIGPGGRGPEAAVRPLLGPRQSSVFSVPARAAIYAQDYGEACRIAQETSDPPRKVAKQCFNLFPKIREIDQLLDEAERRRVFEVHPEVAFWRLNGHQAMSLPKKVKSRPNPEGLTERRDLLIRMGFEPDFFSQKPAGRIGDDDLLDAAVNALIAERLLTGLAEPFPNPPDYDAEGNVIAIWA